ncbi:MAG: hydrogenase-1 expression HyaE [Alphaproteobacteria bacterium]
MFTPLLQSIIDSNGYQVVTPEDMDGLIAAEDFAVLFFAGDANRLNDSNDVAVVLPQLHAVFDCIFTPFVVHRDAERPLQCRYHFNAYPALVFLRRGEYLGTIQQIQDWAEYLLQIAEILEREPSEPPPFKLPDGCGTSDAMLTNGVQQKNDVVLPH